MSIISSSSLSSLIPKTLIPKTLIISNNLLKSPKTLTLKPKPLSLLFSIPKKPIFNKKICSISPKSLFTGIVEEMGQISQLGIAKNVQNGENVEKNVQNGENCEKNDQNGENCEKKDNFTLTIVAKTVLQDVHLGDSIAVNGTCLTVTNFDKNEFTVGLAPETLRKTSLVELKIGSFVNLERAVKIDTRLGGHFVQGHVDGTGEIVEKTKENDSLWIKVKTDSEILKYIVPKGYITVDGASLTVVKVFEEEMCFNFMLVDYTQKHVVIPMKKVGEKVNLEVDILGKYVERLLKSGFVDSFKNK